eukprot:gene26817-biopygen17406
MNSYHDECVRLRNRAGNRSCRSRSQLRFPARFRSRTHS